MEIRIMITRRKNTVVRSFALRVELLLSWENFIVNCGQSEEKFVR